MKTSKLFFVIAGLLILAGAGCEDYAQNGNTVVITPTSTQNSVTSTRGQGDNGSPPSTSTATMPAMDKALCESGRGHWNECASACRNQPEGSPCIMMCVQQCECGGIAGWGCPSGYECKDYVPGPDVPDALGVCGAKTAANE